MTDVFRKEYKKLSDETITIINSIKGIAEKLHDAMENYPIEHDKRAMALAKTNLEQAVMWAVKAIT